MDKIKLGLFDIFVYILPGSILLLCIDLINNPRIDFAEHFFKNSSKFNLFQVTIILSVSYLLGFLNQYFSYEVFKILAKRLWSKRLTGKETSIGKLEDKIVMIRHFSPENFNSLNTWLVLRGMCYSLFVATTVLFLIVLIISIRIDCYKDQIFNLLIIGVSAILFLRRSITFHEWVHGTITHCSAKIDEFKEN